MEIIWTAFLKSSRADKYGGSIDSYYIDVSSHEMFDLLKDFLEFYFQYIQGDLIEGKKEAT